MRQPTRIQTQLPGLMERILTVTLRRFQVELETKTEAFQVVLSVETRRLIVTPAAQELPVLMERTRTLLGTQTQ